MAKEGTVSKIMNVLKNTTSYKAVNVSSEALPPFHQLVAVLQQRIRMQRLTFMSVCSVLFITMIYLHLEKKEAMTKALSKEYILTPAFIPDILTKVRPNVLADSLVYEFAEWFAREIGNVNYEDVEVRIKNLEQYMAPDFRVKYKMAMREKIELWKTRKVDQRFVFQKVDKFERKNVTYKEENTSGEAVELQAVEYTVNVWGNVRTYVDGRQMPVERERMTIQFRTRNINADKTWLFETTNIERVTEKDLEKTLASEKKE